MNKIDIATSTKTEITKYLLNLKKPNNEGLLLTVVESNKRKCIRFIHCDIHTNGDILALANTESQIYFIDFKTKRYWSLKKLISCSCIKLSEYSDSYIFVGKNSGVLEVLDIDSGSVIAKLLGHEHPVISVSFSQSNICVSVSRYEALLWDLTTYSKLQVLSLESNCTLKFVQFIPVSNNILVCYQDDVMQIWDTNYLKSLKQFLPSNWQNYIVKSIAFTKNGKIMVVSGYLPVLAIFQLDIWKILKVINLPEEINTVKKIMFIPQNFDGGNNKLLAILSGNGILYFYDIEQNIIISQLKTRYEIINCNISSRNVKYISCILSSGEVEIYDLSQYLLQNKRTLIEKAKCSSNISGRKAKLKYFNRKPDSSLTQKIDFLLDVDKLKIIIREYQELPTAYRYMIWEKVLKLPNNVKQYNSMLSHITIVAFTDIYQQFHLEDKVSIQCLKHVLNSIVTWCPFFAQVDFLPFFIFPFVKVFHKKPIACFELCCTILINWCQHWFEYHPLPPMNVLAIIDNVFIEHDPELLYHLSSHKISPNVYSWLVLESAFSEVLSTCQWLVFWDHVFINEPAFLLCALVAYHILQRQHLLLLSEEQSYISFFRSQRPIDIRKLINKIYYILDNTSKRNHPRQYLKPFTSLTSGSYPAFDEYPKDIVNFQTEHVARLEHQMKQIKEIRKNIVKSSDCQSVYNKQAIVNEEERRLIDVEKACLQKIKNYQEALKSQQQELALMKNELYKREMEIIGNTQKDLKKHKSATSAGALEVLMEGLDMSEEFNNSELAKLRDMYNEKYLSLLKKEQALEKLIHSDKPSINIGDGLLSARKEALKVKDEIKKTENKFTSPGKADVAITFSALNSLIDKIKVQLEKEKYKSNNSSVKENLKIHELELETKALQQDISKLLSLLGIRNKPNCNDKDKYVKFSK